MLVARVFAQLTQTFIHKIELHESREGVVWESVVQDLKLAHLEEMPDNKKPARSGLSADGAKSFGWM